MIAGLVEPASSPFGFGCGTSVALAAMGTCIVRPGGIPPCSSNFRVDQGRTPGSLLVFRCVYGVRMDSFLDSLSKGGRKVDWREASGGKLKKQGTTGKASDVW